MTALSHESELLEVGKEERKDERKSLDKRHWIYTPIPLDALSTAYTLSIWALLGYGKLAIYTAVFGATC